MNFYSLGLLQKSVGIDFKVVNRSNQVEAQSKSLSAITISLTQDTKHFQFTKNMFNQNPLASQGTIALLLSFRERVIFGSLEGRLAVFMKLCQA